MPQAQVQSEAPIQTNPETTPTPTTTRTTTVTTGVSSSDYHSYINKLPTFAGRGTAIAKRLEDVKADPKYQKLSPEHQARVRKDIYNKYVVPSYSGFHLSVPDEKTWVEASGRDTSFGYPGGAKEKFSDSFKASSSYSSPQEQHRHEDLQSLISGIDKTTSGITLFGLKSAGYLIDKAYGLNQYFTKKIAPEPVAQANEKAYKAVRQKISNAVDAERNWMQSDDFWTQTHPRDTIIGKLVEPAGELITTLPLYEALGSTEAVQAIGKAAPLTQRLMKSPVGKWVANRVINATDGYLTGLIASGSNNQSAVSDAEGFAAFGATTDAAFAGLKTAAYPLIKKWTANTVAMGGTHLAQSVAEHVSGVLDEELEAAAEADSKGSPSTGESLAKNDPVLAKLYQGETASQNSIARQLFSGRNLNQLSKAQRAQVLLKRGELILQAAKEAPAHLPELTHNEVQESTQKFLENTKATNPAYAKQLDALQQILQSGNNKVDLVQPTTDSIIEDVKKSTGISNSPAASRKLRKSTKDITEGFASLKPEDVLKGSAETRAFLRAPGNRKKFAEAVSEAVKGNWDKFYEISKQSDKSGFQYELPEQRLLYLYGHREDLPSAFSKQVLYRIKQLEGYKDLSASEIYSRGKNVQNHMMDMAKRGTKDIGNNIYASTKFDKANSAGTPWDKQLTDERVQKTIAANRKALKQHPEALGAFDAALKSFTRKVRQSKTPEQYRELMEKLDRSVSTNVQKAKTGQKFIFQR